MVEAVKLEVVKTLTAVEIRAKDDVPQADDKAHVQNVQLQHGGGDDPGGEGASPPEPKKAQPSVRHTEKVGRNDPCPCGSGKKYKHCHGKLT